MLFFVGWLALLWCFKVANLPFSLKAIRALGKTSGVFFYIIYKGFKTKV